MTIETSSVGGKIRDIGKRRIDTSRFLPILGRKLVTRITPKLFLCDMGAMGERRIVDGGLLLCLLGEDTRRWLNFPQFSVSLNADYSAGHTPADECQAGTECDFPQPNRCRFSSH
jgi:hypothetical protein